MEITIYSETLEQAILDDDNLTAEDKEMVEEKIDDYIQCLVDDLKGDGNEVSVESQATTPGPVYHAVQDDGQLTDIDIIGFWDWCN